jgi:predicted Rossmann fold nucleotide-binding protein DprA/Smf involved in DNA uptake
MLGPGQSRLVEEQVASLDSDLEAVLAAVESGHSTCDTVATAAGLSGPAASAALARLELLGCLACSNVGNYSKTLRDTIM